MSWNNQQPPAYNPGFQTAPAQQYGQPYGAQNAHGATQPYGATPQQYGGQYGAPAQTPYGNPYGTPGVPPGAPPGVAGAPPGADPTLWNWFQTVDRDRSGSITSDELKAALLNGNWSHFNDETCRLMIGMFDTDKNGTINFQEFSALWQYIQQWKGCFDSFDRDRSGTIDVNELQTAFTSFGYRLSLQFCQMAVRIFDRTNVNSMKFDDFIQCCVMLKGMTHSFRKYDTQQKGVITISYEQFLEMVIDTSIV